MRGDQNTYIDQTDIYDINISDIENNSDESTTCDQNNSDNQKICVNTVLVTEEKLGIAEDHEANVQLKSWALDDVLTNELGQFGWYQMRNILLVAIPMVMSGLMTEYIFSAAPTPHRCRISECGEVGKLQKYEPEWIKNAMPHTSSGFASCERYAPVDLHVNGSLESCPANLFNKSKTVPCEDFVYANDNTVVYEFDLGCKEWLRALAGTLYSTGTLFVMPIAGYISDRYGRKIALIVNIFNLGLFGFIRSFSVNYTMYLALQIVQTTFGSGAFSAAYIFVTELVGPNYRVIASATSNSLFAFGEVMLGSVAWLIAPWRYMILAIHIPFFFVILYYWILPESVRWLLSKKKYTEAKEILNTVARVNKTQIDQKSMDSLTSPALPLTTTENAERPGLLRAVLSSPALVRRVCTTPVWWVTTALIYYGLSINSTGLSDTIHLNYILTCAIEIPGFFTAAIFLDRYGRKRIISSGFFFCAACNIVFAFVPRDNTIPRLIVYLLGKFGISTVATSVYLYTSELYPTEYRHTLLGFSSMVGRVGAIAAPLTPVLMIYWHGIPSLLFGGMAVIAGLLVLTQPETLGCKMPDTLAEAEAIGKLDTKI